ncbi:MAG: rRNA maturation RNase YbeY [Eggerthellaceae bacterium]|nr:rRNA maturation RNase YbeY [Eggerthellaceae bacterium]
MEVLVNIEHGADLVEEVNVEGICAFAMEHMKLPSNAEVSVTFIDNEEMARLNKEYRGIEGPTDVLSFECDNVEDELSSSRAEDAPYELGDIVIAPDVAAAQSDDYGTSIVEEFELLLVHGILHLCGMDHEKDDEAKVMEAREQELLNAWRAL